MIDKISDELDDEEELVLEIKPVRRAYFWWYLFSAFIAITGVLVPVSLCIVVIIEFCLRLNDYKITNQRLISRNGIIYRNLEELELFRVKDVSVSQGVLGRILNYGNVKIISTDPTTPTIKFVGVDTPIKIKEELRKHYRQSRKKEKVYSREFI